MLSYESTWKDVEKARPEGAVIGIGAVEQHGHHLPLCVDCLSADYLARGIAKEMEWYLLPLMPYGTSCEHMDFPGTVTMRSETLLSFFGDVADSLERHRIPRLAVVSGHGGNWFLKMMCREMNYRREKIKVYIINADRWFYPVLQQMTGDKSLHHAGEHETGIVMHLRPELVKKDVPPDENPAYEFDMLDLVQSRSLAGKGHWGFPSKGSAENGKEFLERALKVSVEYLRSRIKLTEKLR